MSEHTPTRAIFPGTFDPITNGHLDIISRGADLFDELIVAVGQNPEKTAWLKQDRRADIIRDVLEAEGLSGVRVEAFEGLTVDFARRENATAILRGIRDSSDLHYEFQVALTNRVVAGIETVFIITSAEHAFTSSSLIRQIASMGGDVSALVPEQVIAHLVENGPATRGDATIEETE
jgi:pantetheine-phosphate adenylyltransferase